VHYYGYRYYKADMGRWVSRDPIAEKGGVAIYGFSKNNGVGRVDFLGLISIPVGSWTVDVTESGGSATYSLPPINIVVPFIVGWFGYIYQINGNGDVVINVTPNGLEEFDCTALPDDPSTTTSATTCSFSFASGLSCTSTKTVQNSSKMAQTEVTYGLQGFVVSASMNATGEARYRKWIDYPMCKCFDGKATLNYTVSTSGDLLKAALGGVLILASQYFIVPVAANVGLPVPAFVVP
jgi:uncharacterized protein RhaS with RHS repeats